MESQWVKFYWKKHHHAILDINRLCPFVCWGLTFPLWKFSRKISFAGLMNLAHPQTSKPRGLQRNTVIVILYQYQCAHCYYEELMITTPHKQCWFGIIFKSSSIGNQINGILGTDNIGMIVELLKLKPSLGNERK